MSILFRSSSSTITYHSAMVAVLLILFFNTTKTRVMRTHLFWPWNMTFAAARWQSTQLMKRIMYRSHLSPFSKTVSTIQEFTSTHTNSQTSPICLRTHYWCKYWPRSSALTIRSLVASSWPPKITTCSSKKNCRQHLSRLITRSALGPGKSLLTCTLPTTMTL